MTTISRKASRERGPVRTYGLFYAGPQGERRFGGFEWKSGVDLPNGERLNPAGAQALAQGYARDVNRQRGGVGPRVYVGCLENRKEG